MAVNESFVVTFRAKGADAVARATKQITEQMKRVGKAMRTVGKIGAGVGAAGIGAFGVALNASRKRVDDFAKTALRLETSTDVVQALSSAAREAGTNLERLAPGIQRLSAGVAQASAKGKGAQFEALQALGFDRRGIERLAKQSQIAIFQEVGRAFSRLTGAGQQLAGQSLFGQRAFGQLQPFLRAGGFENTQATLERNRRLGIDIGGGEGGRTEQMNDTMQRIGDVFKGLVDKMAGSPELLQGLKAFEAALHEVIESFGGGAEVARQFGAAIKGIASAMTLPGRIGRGIGSALSSLTTRSTSQTDKDYQDSIKRGTSEGMLDASRKGAFRAQVSGG